MAKDETPAQVRDRIARDDFERAERSCAAGYSAQGGPRSDPEEREDQREARAARNASAFEELYCTLRDIADDWHRESIRRRDGKEKGVFQAAYCDPEKSIELTFKAALRRVKDWDY